MSRFDDALESVKRGFDIAAAKTGDAVEASKLKVERSQVKTRINSLYARLGKAYYASRKGDDSESELIEKIVEKLEGAMSDLDDIEMLIANTKSVKCQICGKKNSAGADFCKECGTPLYEDNEEI